MSSRLDIQADPEIDRPCKRSKPSGERSDGEYSDAIEVIHIDGSMLEGGGQILRNASALAAITKQTIQVTSIRAGRKVPGLGPQHLTGLQLVAALCGGNLTGGQVRSTSITLTPSSPRCGSYTADTMTAGSCALLAQSSLPCALFAKPQPPPTWTSAPSSQQAAGPAPAATTSLKLLGGTDADLAPPASYLREVLAPLLHSKLGLQLQVEVLRRGFYPRGGGILSVKVDALPPGTSLPPIDLAQRGHITSIDIHSFAAGRVSSGAEQRMAAAAAAELRRGLARLGCSAAPVVQHAVRESSDSAVGDGSGVLLVAHTSAGCRLAASAKGERGQAAEAAGTIAAAELLELLATGACVDEHLADQLVIFMALAKGRSRMLCAEPSLHCRTAMVVAERLLQGVRFTVAKAAAGQNGPAAESEAQPAQAAPHASADQPLYVVSCDGAGWVAGME